MKGNLTAGEELVSRKSEIMFYLAPSEVKEEIRTLALKAFRVGVSEGVLKFVRKVEEGEIIFLSTPEEILPEWTQDFVPDEELIIPQVSSESLKDCLGDLTEKVDKFFIKCYEEGKGLMEYIAGNLYFENKISVPEMDRTMAQ